jgi:hypothetical protein
MIGGKLVLLTTLPVISRTRDALDPRNTQTQRVWPASF